MLDRNNIINKHSGNSVSDGVGNGVSNSISNDVSYNKRQFWEYKRLYGGGKNGKVSHNNAKRTRKVFHLVNNKVATDTALVKRLSTIYIPPAYKDIVVAKSINNKIQAIGTDARGRRQYVYNTIYTKKRNDRKYEDIMELAKHIGLIEKDNEKLLKEIVKKEVLNWNLPDDYIPIIVYMLRTYHFRIGNERYANDNHSYGITTMRAEHIKWDSSKPNKFTIEFIGKKGILNSFSDDNAIIAKLMHKLIEGSKRKGHGGFLFKYTHDGIIHFITPEHIQGFFQSKYHAYITPKMFRTWYGNYHLLVCLRNLFNAGKLKTRLKQYEKNEIIKECSEHVSSKLNNTPTVSKQSYIDNKILELVMKNPYRFASNIPNDSEGQHKYLYKIIMKLRHT